MKRVHDAKTVIWGADSDHRAIIMRLDIGEAQRLYTDKPHMRVDRTVLHDPVKRKEFQQAVTKNISLLDNAHVDGVPATKLQVLQNAMIAAADEVLKIDGRRRPGWFVAARVSLEPAIAERNKAMAAYLADPQCTEKKDAARGARKAVRRVIEAAKRDWIDGVLSV